MIEIRIGEYIKKARIMRGLTTKELGEKSKVNYRSIESYERNTQFPKLESLIKLSRVLCVSLDSLIGNEVLTSMENVFTVDEFSYLTELIRKCAENDTLFNQYNYLLDKCENALSSMKYKKSLHMIENEPRQRDVKSGNFFLIRREMMHVTRNDLARACGVTTNVISDWESGFKKPTRNHIPTLKTWLNLTNDEIETYIDPNYRKNHIMKTIEKMSATQLDVINNMVDTIISDGEEYEY